LDGGVDTTCLQNINGSKDNSKYRAHPALFLELQSDIILGLGLGAAEHAFSKRVTSRSFAVGK
jgi:hypothetical protein